MTEAELAAALRDFDDDGEYAVVRYTEGDDGLYSNGGIVTLWVPLGRDGPTKRVSLDIETPEGTIRLRPEQVVDITR